jgi:hypothetical protein
MSGHAVPYPPAAWRPAHAQELYQMPDTHWTCFEPAKLPRLANVNPNQGCQRRPLTCPDRAAWCQCANNKRMQAVRAASSPAQRKQTSSSSIQASGAHATYPASQRPCGAPCDRVFAAIVVGAQHEASPGSRWVGDDLSRHWAFLESPCRSVFVLEPSYVPDDSAVCDRTLLGSFGAVWLQEMMLPGRMRTRRAARMQGSGRLAFLHPVVHA